MKNLEANISLPPAKVKGRYKLTVRKPNGDIRLETDWFDNLVTNNGLDELITLNGSGSSWARYCRIGSGSTTPSFTDTALNSQYASTSTIQTRTTSYVTGPPAYISHTVVYRFDAVGVGVTRTITEIGVSSGSATPLISRALVLNTSGNPITITMIEGEVLDATYQYDYYFALMTNDYTQTITIDSVTYTVTWRASSTSSDSYSAFGAAQTGSNSTLSPLSGYYAYFHSGTIGAVTTTPSGTASASITSVASTYATGSYQKTFTWSLGLNDANYIGGIGAARFNNTGITSYNTMRYQCGFSPNIPKTENDTMKISATISVARY